MTQTVSSQVASSNHTTLLSNGSFTVKTGLDGTSGLPDGVYDINWYNSGPNGANPGYDTHTTWYADCMTRAAGQLGTKLGTVTLTSGVDHRDNRHLQCNVHLWQRQLAMGKAPVYGLFCHLLGGNV